jgi:hypothetical protein
MLKLGHRPPGAIGIVAALTVASGVIVALRMTPTT